MKGNMYSGKSKSVIQPENLGKVNSKDPQMEQADARIGKGSTVTSTRTGVGPKVKVPNITIPKQPKVVDSAVHERMAKARAARGKSKPIKIETKSRSRVLKPAPKLIPVKVVVPAVKKTEKTQIKIDVSIEQK